MGEVSRARQCLIGASVAQGLTRLSQQCKKEDLRFRSEKIPEEVSNLQPQTILWCLGRSLFLKSFQTASRGSSPGAGGYTYEHFRVLIDDTATPELFFGAGPNSQGRLRSSDERMVGCSQQGGRWGARHRHGVHDRRIGREDSCSTILERV